MWELGSQDTEQALECPELSATEESAVPGCRAAAANLLGKPQEMSAALLFESKEQKQKQSKKTEEIVPVVSIPRQRGNSSRLRVQKPKSQAILVAITRPQSLQLLRHQQTHRGRANYIGASNPHQRVFLMHIQNLEDKTCMTHTKSVLFSSIFIRTLNFCLPC